MATDPKRRDWYSQTIAAAVLITLALGLALWFLTNPEALRPTDQLAAMSRAIVHLVLIGALTGVTAMATVQFWKVFFKPRVAFHKAQLYACLGDEAANQLLSLAASGFAEFSEEGASKETSSKEKVTDGGGRDDLLNSPTEILMAQIGSAAEYILMRPGEYKVALQKLVGSRGGGEVKRYLEVKSHQPDDYETAAERIDEALYPVRFFVEQNLDLLLVRIRDRWRARVQLYAALVSAGIGLFVIVLTPVGPFLKVSTVAAALVWGGFFAWFARDLVSLAERHRN